MSNSPLQVWCFGCIGSPGHHLRKPDRTLCFDEKAQPWGWSLDGGLCKPPEFQRRDGGVWVHHKDGWTAVAFWDQSCDERGASCTVFLMQAVVRAEDILTAAKEQWPMVWNRPGFPLANGIILLP